jgi:hypothetical protein
MPKQKQNINKLISDETIIRKIYVIRLHMWVLDWKPMQSQITTASGHDNMRSEIVTSSAQDVYFQKTKTMRSQIVTA